MHKNFSLLSKISLFFYCVLLALHVSVSSYAQTKEEKITHIKQLFAAINADKSYKKIVLSNEEAVTDGIYTDRGMEVTGYFKGDKLVKITEWVGVSNGNHTIEYYLDGDSLSFVFVRFQIFAYTDSAGFDYSKLGEEILEGRYYYDKGKLIDEVVKGEKGYEDVSTSLVPDEKKYASMLYKKKSSGK